MLLSFKFCSVKWKDIFAKNILEYDSYYESHEYNDIEN